MQYLQIISVGFIHQQAWELWGRAEGNPQARCLEANSNLRAQYKDREPPHSCLMGF